MTPPRELVRAFLEEDGFLLATHINPEGDALGSTLALYDALRQLGKKARVYDRDPVPEIYKFLPGWHGLDCRIPVNTGELALVLIDCGNPDRAALKGVRFRKGFVIDHHETEAGFGDIVWVEPHAPAAGLMVFELLKSLGVKITREMALNLYTAISTDTGVFRYENTTAEALEASAELVRLGAQPALVAGNVYESWRPGRMRLLALALQTLDIRDGIAVISISKEMLEATGTTIEDTDNFTSFPRMIAGMRASGVFMEVEDGMVRASLRSKGILDVRAIAEGFGGGGHRNAAGFRVNAGLNEAKELFFRAAVEAVPKRG